VLLPLPPPPRGQYPSLCHAFHGGYVRLNRVGVTAHLAGAESSPHDQTGQA
jgi:hypothetical protein